MSIKLNARPTVHGDLDMYDGDESLGVTLEQNTDYEENFYQFICVDETEEILNKKYNMKMSFWGDEYTCVLDAISKFRDEIED